MIDLSLLQRGIDASGFPFELRVASALIDLGYDVRPSQYFLDRDRSKDAELDLVATKQFAVPVSPQATVKATLRLAIECKDTSNAYVCFGLPSRSRSIHDIGGDLFTPHFRTSRDAGIKGRFNVVLFHRDRGPERQVVAHHHYQGPTRYHAVAVADVHGGGRDQRCRVTSNDATRHALTKLGAYVGLAAEHGIDDRSLEDLQGGPYINVLFAALIHPGPHYCFSLSAAAPEQATHTPVFQSRSYLHSSLYYIVDVVSFEAIAAAVSTIEASCSALVERVGPFMLAAS